MPIDTLEQLLETEQRDLLDADKQMTRALLKLAKAVSRPDLLRQTEEEEGAADKKLTGIAAHLLQEVGQAPIDEDGEEIDEDEDEEDDEDEESEDDEDLEDDDDEDDEDEDDEEEEDEPQDVMPAPAPVKKPSPANRR